VAAWITTYLEVSADAVDGIVKS